MGEVVYICKECGRRIVGGDPKEYTYRGEKGRIYHNARLPMGVTVACGPLERQGDE